MDQEEMSPCTVTKNAICQCRTGTYCHRNATCNECLLCRPSCPKEQVLQQTCSSTSDNVCVTVTPDPSDPSVVIPLFFGVLVTLVAIILICAWLFCRKNGYRLILEQKIFTKCLKHKEASEKDAESPFLPHKSSKLYMKTDIIGDEAFTRTFRIFVDLVPARIFEKFVLELGLTNNEINIAKQDIGFPEEQHLAMLLQLHRDHQRFDVNIWLSKLDSIRLEKVAQDITIRLIKDGLFERTG
ncbi:tumor necrosis factor receptor superfamily member 10B-like [Anomaloglossus baeobatrachus]